ncbi:hypothetical protein CVT26_007167 [Gymnopilus dilepis]|uniref:Uncharacterized protein n=1 Tax=Gymnopilus dilepis TaxID=231916 RepID=A0A409W0F1_9AGAR|nr:hypothetical protein CVT26_007167 [Gymnopilus dilepis]
MSIHCDDESILEERYGAFTEAEDYDYTRFEVKDYRSSSSVHGSAVSGVHYSNPRSSSSPWSFRQLQPSSRTSEYTTPSDRDRRHDIWQTAKSQSVSTTNIPVTRYYPFGQDDEDPQGQETSQGELPTIIQFQPSRKGQPSCVYGSLFEQRDPWRTIGFILGLEEKPNAEEGRGRAGPNCEVGVEETNMHEPFMDSGHSDEEEDTALEGSPFDDIWKGEGYMNDIDEFLQDQTHLVSKSAEISQRILGSDDDDRREENHFSDNGDLSDEEIQMTNTFSSQHNDVTSRKAISISEPRSSSRSSNKGDDNGNGERDTANNLQNFQQEEVGQSAYEKIETADEPASSPGHDIDMEIDKPEPPRPDAVMEEQSEAEDSPQKSLNVFALPELREVDGLYLGPSLFDGFDESEDEA